MAVAGSGSPEEALEEGAALPRLGSGVKLPAETGVAPTTVLQPGVWIFGGGYVNPGP